jgi:hypothetical protein
MQTNFKRKDFLQFVPPPPKLKKLYESRQYFRSDAMLVLAFCDGAENKFRHSAFRAMQRCYARPIPHK